MCDTPETYALRGEPSTEREGKCRAERDGPRVLRRGEERETPSGSRCTCVLCALPGDVRLVSDLVLRDVDSCT